MIGQHQFPMGVFKPRRRYGFSRRSSVDAPRGSTRPSAKAARMPSALQCTWIFARADSARDRERSTHFSPSTCSASPLSILFLKPPLTNLSAGPLLDLMIWYSVLPANPTPITPSTEAIVAMMRYSLGWSLQKIVWDNSVGALECTIDVSSVRLGTVT